ncbi:MAG: primosomal protein N', partial [Patescibacteria group bacterium]
MQKSYYFEIAVASVSAKKQAIFTYSSVTRCKRGQLVVVKLRSKKVLGVVINESKKPKFKTNPIENVLNEVLSPAHITTLLWAVDYYPFDKGAVVRLFLPPSEPSIKPVAELPGAIDNKAKLPGLTSDQTKAIAVVQDHPKETIILHGDTGSGKTLVYVELIRKCLSEGQSVILLVPEIALGEQLKLMVGKYIDNIVVYNSLQTASVRRNIWYGLYRSKLPQVVIGPRSALFLPLPNIGMVIIDEAHDTSYKQQQAPYYSSLHIAGTLTKSLGTGLIYGSATPNATDYKIALDKEYPIVTLKERPIATASQLGSSFKVINTKDRGLFSKNQTLSDDVISAIRRSVKSGKQALLLLNKRGTAHLIQCESCGWQYRCEVCDHTLVYHKDRHLAICHYCDHKYPMHSTCPIDNGRLKLMSVGTKYVEEDCRKLFPQVPILRLDTDSITRDTVLEKMDSIHSGKTSIIIGTQLVAKGLDLPLLETIVVIDARRQSSDYLGDERYYQLLHQVIGRGMRGHQETTIFLQTPDITDPLITWATTEDWTAFYNQEVDDRAKFNYPPSTYLAVYRIKRRTSVGLEAVVQKVQA